MEEIKNLYVLEWYGPYNSINEVWEDDDTSICSIYLITGKGKYERGPEHIKYVGITEREPGKRLSEPDHLEKQLEIRYKKYWVGRFSRYSNLNIRTHAESIETLFVRYLSLQYVRINNIKKIKKVPEAPIVVINRWFLKSKDSHRVNKPSRLVDLPDVLLFDGEEYWGSDKLRFLNSEE